MKYALALLLLCSSFTTAAFAGPSPEDAKNIQGTWLLAKAELAGKPMPADFLTNTVMELKGTNYLVTVSGSPDKGTFAIDTTAMPKSITIHGTEGPNTGRTINGIYELKGDTLKICYNLANGLAPAEFVSPAGVKIFLVTYERKK